MTPLIRIQEAIAAHLTCTLAIDGMTSVAEAVLIAGRTGDELEDARNGFGGLPIELRSAVVNAHQKMDAALRRLNQRVLLAAMGMQLEQQRTGLHAVLARVPEIMAKEMAAK